MVTQSVYFPDAIVDGKCVGLWISKHFTRNLYGFIVLALFIVQNGNVGYDNGCLVLVLQVFSSGERLLIK